MRPAEPVTMMTLLTELQPCLTTALTRNLHASVVNELRRRKKGEMWSSAKAAFFKPGEKHVLCNGVREIFAPGLQSQTPHPVPGLSAFLQSLQHCHEQFSAWFIDHL